MSRIIILFVIFFELKIFANGGPVDGCAVYKTGNVKLINEENVELIKEFLDIKIKGDYSIVNVTYILKNDNYFDKKITYGFPIDIEINELIESDWKKDYLPYINFKLNTTYLKIRRHIDYTIVQDHCECDSVYKPDTKRIWYIIDFSIKKDAIDTLRVSYKIKNNFVDWGTSKEFFPTFGYRRFMYDFKPASKWKDGTIKELNIRVDAKEIINNKSKIEIKGWELNNNNGIFEGIFKNYDLRNAPELFISYERPDILSEFISKYRIKNNKILSIKATSVHSKEYSEKNVLDFNFNTSLRIKGKGIGEKIEITIDKFSFGAICILNGNTKSAELYKKNNRIKKLKVDIEFVYENIRNYYDSKNDSIIDDIKYDEIENIPKIYVNKDTILYSKILQKNNTEIISEIILLADKEYINPSIKNFANMINFIGDYGDGRENVRKITFTILDVYEGTGENPDTYISEIFILGYDNQ